MKLLLHKLSRKLAHFSDFLIAFGPFGLFVVALLDSSFVPLPSSADALMVLLTVAHPHWMLVYAAIATTGSGLGCLILYYVSKRTGSRALSRFSPTKQKRVRELIERYDVLAVLVASLLPPPFPFKLFVISAGVFGFSTTRFLVAILAGRAFRFLLEGYFAIRFGQQAKAVLATYYPWIGLGLAAIVISLFVLRTVFKRKAHSVLESGLEAGN